MDMQRREHNERAWLAWHVAALQRVKRMPKLERLFAKKRVPDQTLDQQMAIMGQWKARRDRMFEALSKANG